MVRRLQYAAPLHSAIWLTAFVLLIEFLADEATRWFALIDTRHLQKKSGHIFLRPRSLTLSRRPSPPLWSRDPSAKTSRFLDLRETVQVTSYGFPLGPKHTRHTIRSLVFLSRRPTHAADGCAAPIRNAGAICMRA